MQQEVWKDIPGFIGHYQISNLGQIKSLDRLVPRNGFLLTKKGRILKQFICKNGYPSIKLLLNTDRTAYSVHRIVAQVFIENPENKREVNHLDLDKTNNNCLNLEWCTPSENMIHAVKSGALPHVGVFGSENHSAKSVVNLQTGIFYDTILNAYESTSKNKSETYFRSMLNGNKKNRTNFEII